MSEENNIYLLEKLQPEPGYETAGAIFLTYTIKERTVVSALLYLMNLVKNGDQYDPVKKRINTLLDFYRSGKLDADTICFVCNNGYEKYDKSQMSDLYGFAHEFMAYYCPEDEYSFHPKLYIIKYVNQEDENDVCFRIMIGSMNFVNSLNKEFMAVYDLKAYTDPKEGYIKLRGNNQKTNILEALLNIQDDGKHSNNIDSRHLSKVIGNLGLDQYWFDPEDVPEIFVFPNSEEGLKKKLKNASMVFSPFLTAKNLTNPENLDQEIYTMEHELNKLGYNADLENSSGAKEFFVYEVEGQDTSDKKMSSHFKAYVCDDGIYIGSLNYTDRAFYKNKEIIVRLPYDPDLVEQLKQDYTQKPFAKKSETQGDSDEASDLENEGAEDEPESESTDKAIADTFRAIAQEICKMYQFGVDKDNKGWCAYLIKNTNDAQADDKIPGMEDDKIPGMEEMWKKLQELQKKKIKDERQQALSTTCQLSVSPIAYERKKKVLIPECLPEKLCWSGLNRGKICQQFLIAFEMKEGDAEYKTQLSVCMHFQWQEELDAKGDTRSEFEKAHTDFSKFMLPGWFAHTEKNETGTSGRQGNNDSREYRSASQYIKYNLPTVEQIICEALENSKPLNEIIQKYSNLIQVIHTIWDEYKNGTMSEEEQRDLAIGDKTLVENWMGQIESLQKNIKDE